MKIVYIDAQNIHKALQNYHDWIIDWKKFYVFCKEKYKADEVKIFQGYVKKYDKFYAYLRIIGYKIYFKETMVLSNGNIKGNVDIDIAVISLRDFYEK